MDGPPVSASNVSNSSQKRPMQDSDENQRKRAKYTSTACNECKRCKVKCIRLEDDANCQRCINMKVCCVVVPTAAQSAKDRDKERQTSRVDESHLKQLSDDITSLRQQVTALTATVATLVTKPSVPVTNSANPTPLPQSASPTYTATTLHQPREPIKPMFVGPTRSDFSFNIAETSLTRMGITLNNGLSVGPSSLPSSREPTPEALHESPSQFMSSERDCLLQFSDAEAVRLVGIYEEDIACVHPIIDTKALVCNVSQILAWVKHPERLSISGTRIDKKDANILKMAMATALTDESHGKNELSDKLVASVEEDVCRISVQNETELKDIQIMGMLSLYFCHTSEELFAWRAIGKAARQSLEMGLHRKQSLMDNFKNEQVRNLAIQVFWVVYELDRRWSFGTSLSFALNDRDIDPQLPEPGKEHPYLRCMVAYAKLCSRVWEALPPYGSSLQLIPKETEEYLDFMIQNWLSSIPTELQFKHPNSYLTPQIQSRQLRRLSTLLYLRRNYVRTLVHRHHVLTSENIKADMRGAHLVIDVAKDTISVLVHLNDTTDIYIREQSIYHYYLLSALAVVLLAVCHSPAAFAESSKASFISAVELVKGFSRRSSASRRLWKSIRGLLPVIKSLSLRAEPNRKHDARRPSITIKEPLRPHGVLDQRQNTVGPFIGDGPDLCTSNVPGFSEEFGNMPDIYDMSNDLLDLYDVFDSAATNQIQQPNGSAETIGEIAMSTWEIEEVSRHFQGLL